MPWFGRMNRSTQVRKKTTLWIIASVSLQHLAAMYKANRTQAGGTCAKAFTRIKRQGHLHHVKHHSKENVHHGEDFFFFFGKHPLIYFWLLYNISVFSNTLWVKFSTSLGLLFQKQSPFNVKAMLKLSLSALKRANDVFLVTPHII